MPKIATLKSVIPTLRPQLRELQTASWRAHRHTAAQRGYGYRWQKARAAFLLANPLCRYCIRAGRTTPASVVDHIERHEGDAQLFWDRANWQPLCKTCHDGLKARQEAQEAAGRVG
ncbi:HNH endonuclease [Bordetella genomosp. 1]|uniref:Putative HNH nuclease YajD n=2 Tax=Bordetella genomosp. 1 TaxID=1395607 RepID=A0A261SFV3_9BORD|nr:HNH endonuclease [Bordetella genomosp. 1]